MWEGIVTHEGGIRRVDLRQDAEDDSLAADLARLESRLEGRRPICVMHSPPSKTRLVCIGPGVHVGSHAARDFIRRVQPSVALHGHIHESPHYGEGFSDYIGESLCVNPGQSGGGQLHAVLFDPHDPGGSLVHTVYGPPAISSPSIP